MQFLFLNTIFYFAELYLNIFIFKTLNRYSASDIYRKNGAIYTCIKKA